MGFLFGGGKSSVSETPRLSALAVQTMGFGVPIQICYGSNRISPTLGWSGDFKDIKHVEQSGGGKGFGGGGATNISYTYITSLILLCCEGEIRGYGRLWRDKEKKDSVLSVFSFYTLGTANQNAWGYLATAHPDQALTYPNTAYLAASGYELSNSATLGNHSIEIFGLQLSSNPSAQNYQDAHIKDVITDALTNPVYGVIDSQTANLTLETTAMYSYCVARGLLISPILSEAKPAHDYLSDWLKVANAEIVWSEGKLKFLPYADQAFSNVFGSYTPDTTIRATFNDDNVSEPIMPKRKKLIDCFNKVSVECKDRANEYNNFTVEAKDQAGIENYGLRAADTLTLDCICKPDIALIVAHTLLLRGLYIRNEYTIKTFCTGNIDLLEPLDFISLTDVGLGLQAARCRINSIEDSQDGFITITAEEAPEGVYCG